MKTLWEIMSWVSQKDRFLKIEDYIDFAKYYLDFVKTGLQAEIIAKNENNYSFFQYRRDGEYNITRPINCDLFQRLEEYDGLSSRFIDILSHVKEIQGDMDVRKELNGFIYTT